MNGNLHDIHALRKRLGLVTLTQCDASPSKALPLSVRRFLRRAGREELEQLQYETISRLNEFNAPAAPADRTALHQLLQAELSAYRQTGQEGEGC